MRGCDCMSTGSINIYLSKNDRAKVYNYLSSHIVDIYKEMCKNTVHIGYNFAKKLAKNAVDAFYKWDQNSYHRKHDLYNAYQVGIRDGYELIFELGEEFMEYTHHQGNEMVYNVAFVAGSHGGSPHNGRYYWRTYPFQKGPEHWWPTPAPKIIPSPRKRIVDDWNNFVESTYKPAQLKEFRRLLLQVKEKLGV